MGIRWFKLIIGILLTAAAFSFSVSAGGGQVKVRTGEAELVLEGQPLRLPAGQHIFIYEGRTYIPLRFVSYSLNKDVEWDHKAKIISVYDPAGFKNVSTPQVTNNKPNQTDITVTPLTASFIFNGEMKKLPDKQSAYIYKGTTYVPMRFILESLGIQFNWDKQTKQVIIHSVISSEQGGNADIGAEAEIEEQQADVTDPVAVIGGGGNAGSPSAGTPSDETDEADKTSETGGNVEGDTINKPSYEAVTAEAEQRLSELRSNCKNALADTGLRYFNASTEADRNKIIAEVKKEMDDCTSRFNQIASEYEALLSEHGYSTAIIDEYREQFEEELASGRERFQ